MGSAYDLCRDIDCPAGLYHVSPKGTAHDGPSRLCVWCNGLSERKSSLAIAAHVKARDSHDDTALARCGTNLQSGTRPVTFSSAGWPINDGSMTTGTAEPGMQGGSRPAIHGPPPWLGYFFLALMLFALGFAIGAMVWR